MSVLVLILTALLFGVAAFFVGILYRKNKAEKTISSAESEAERIVQAAKENLEAKKKEVIFEGKEEVHKFRREAEKEISDRRRDLQHQERRLVQKEESLDKKIEKFEQNEKDLTDRNVVVEKKNEEIELLKKEQLKTLEKISGFTVKQAKDYILDNLQNELTHEKAVKIKSYEQELKEECEKKARDILAVAVQRCASDHISNATISVVNLPNDDMKGRIIGREGRNVRTIETLTGVDLIIDDTPEAITVSCFDPVRREVARVSLERLIADGRIHPAKIEEIVEKTKRDIDKDIKEEGQRAVLEAGVTNLHPELIKLVGRMKFRTSYGQNMLRHSIEVAHVCGMMASELGLDPIMARRAGLLHDIGKSLDHETEGSHVEIGVNVLKKYKEPECVLHAVHAHHGDIEPQTALAFLLQAADTASAARPGARREDFDNYIKRLKNLENLVSEYEGVKSCYAIQAGREIRVMVRPDVVTDESMIPLAHDMCKKIEESLVYPGQVKVNIIRESRAVDYAK